MKILIVGAAGFIGSAVVSRLASAGHAIVAVARRPSQTMSPVATWIPLDIARATEPGAWAALLSGVDAVVNCAGILQDGPRGSTAGVHASAPAALFRACEQAGVRRVIHLSAVGVDRETPTEFSRTKFAGDETLMALDLDWVILRPSVVVGSGAYGGSALIRGLASLPVIPVMPDTAPLQIVHLDDLLDAIEFFLRSDAPSKRAVEVVGPKRYTFEQAVALLRRWMRWPPARAVRVPRWLAGILYRLGDFVALFGWQPPIRSTARLEMMRGAVGDSAQLTTITGIEPRDLEATLARQPAPVQERWFAPLYILKPLVFGILALFWFSTGVVSLGPGRERGIQLVMEGGVGRTLATLATISGGLADIFIGIAIAYRRTTRAGLYAAFLISITYAIIGTILLPWLWFDPLGPMLKIAPVIVFNLVALAILDDR